MSRSGLLSLALMTGATGTIAAGTTSVSATDAISVHGIEYLSASVDTKGSIGAVGIEYDAAAVDPYGGYSDSVTWRSDGSLMKVDHEVGSTYLKPKYDVDGLPVPSSATTVRLEAYPRNTTDCTGEDWQAALLGELLRRESNHGGFIWMSFEPTMAPGPKSNDHPGPRRCIWRVRCNRKDRRRNSADGWAGARRGV